VKQFDNKLKDRVALTVTLNHDVVDSTPVTRFAARLIELLEEGQGLSAS
jgi:hypothetical protein